MSQIMRYTHGIRKVAIYIRVSTKLQEDKYSLKAQIHELEKYADQMGWEVYGIFKDVDSGGKLEKQGLEALMDCVEEGNVDAVLVIEQDRLSRLDMGAWDYLKSVLRENQVKLAEPGLITDLGDMDQEFFSDLKNLIARRAKRDIVQKMMRGKRQLSREGKVWGKQPDEYNYDKATGELSINDDNAWVIPFIDEHYLDQGMGTSSIARKLNALCTAPSGARWSERQVLNKLMAKCYHGVFERKFSNGEIVSVEDVYPKLRTKEQYELIQHYRKSRVGRREAEPHILRDMTIRCADCGKIMSVNKKMSIHISKDGQKSKYESWYLVHLRPEIQERCPANPYVNIKRLEHHLLNAVRTALLDDEKQLKSLIAENLDKTELELEKINQEIELLKKSKEEVDTSIDRLLKLYLSGKWDEDKLNANQTELDSKLAEISNHLSALEKKRDLILSNQLNTSSIRSRIDGLMRDVTEQDAAVVAYRFDTWPIETKQRFIGELFPTATLHHESHLELHLSVAEGASLPVIVKIDSMDSVVENELLEASKERLRRLQKYLNENPGTSLDRLCKVFNHNLSTVKADMERTGYQLKHLAPNRQGPEIRATRIKILKSALKSNPELSDRALEKVTGINRKMIAKLIREEKLRG